MTTHIIVGQAKRQARVREAWTLLKEAAAKYQRSKELACQLITHPDATPQQILDTAAQLKRMRDSLVASKKSLYDVARKEGLDYRTVDSIRELRL